MIPALASAIIGALSVAVPMMIAIISGVAWLASRIGRLEAKLDGLVTVRECGQQIDRCRHEFEPREPTGAHAPIMGAAGKAWR